MDLGLTGKAAIVTGGTGGVGRAVTEILAREGCSVAVCDFIPIEAAEKFADSVSESTGARCIAVNADVSKEDDVIEMNNTVISEFGKYDILVNNAAIITDAPPNGIKLADWERVLNVNLTGVFLTSKIAINHFKENGIRGRIINLTSQCAFRGTRSGHAHYSASKAGVVGLTRTQALETAEYGICINAVAPGIIRTSMMEEKIKSREMKYNAEIPLGYIAEPKDVAYAIVFLASEMGSYITGATLDVSGGIMLR